MGVCSDVVEVWNCARRHRQAVPPSPALTWQTGSGRSQPFFAVLANECTECEPWTAAGEASWLSLVASRLTQAR